MKGRRATVPARVTTTGYNIARTVIDGVSTDNRTSGVAIHAATNRPITIFVLQSAFFCQILIFDSKNDWCGSSLLRSKVRLLASLSIAATSLVRPLQAAITRQLTVTAEFHTELRRYTRQPLISLSDPASSKIPRP